MSLRLLAGPFDVTDSFGTPPVSFGPQIWYENLGMIVDVNMGGGLSYRSVMTLDGVLETISLDVSEPVSWWASRKLLLVGGGLTFDPKQEFLYEPHVLARQATGPDNLLGLYPSPYVRLDDPDHRIYAGAGDVFATGQIRSVTMNMELSPPEPVDVTEGPIFPFVGLSSSVGRVKPGRTTTEVFIAHEGSESLILDAQGIFYDTVAKAFSSPLYHIGMPCMSLNYCPEFGVFVSLHRDPWQVRVWSMEVYPTQMSDVQLIAGEIRAGQIATFQIRLQGDKNDPCEGELINWALSAGVLTSPIATAIGTLFSTQSMTDVDGYASVRVQYGLGESGDSVVTASVRI